MSDKKQQKKDKIKAVIVGAGRIAAGFDMPKNKEVLTHAHAFKIHPRIDLVGFYDINFQKARKAADKWSCSAWRDFDEMMKEVKPDIVSICTPDNNHVHALLVVAGYRPKVVICEKPAATDAGELKKVIDIYKKMRVSIEINFFRRFDKTIQSLRNDIARGKYGKIISASGIYTKGIAHNGSHMIDLARFLFGEVARFVPLSAVTDYSSSDLSIGAFIKFERCPQFHLMTGNDKNYGIFELDVLCEKKRFRLTDFSHYLYSQSVVEEPLFKGFYGLGKSKRIETDYIRSLSCMVENVVNHIIKKEPLLCDIEDARKTQQVCGLLLNDVKNKKICQN